MTWTRWESRIGWPLIGSQWLKIVIRDCIPLLALWESHASVISLASLSFPSSFPSLNQRRTIWSIRGFDGRQWQILSQLSEQLPRTSDEMRYRDILSFQLRIWDHWSDQRMLVEIKYKTKVCHKKWSKPPFLSLFLYLLIIFHFFRLFIAFLQQIPFVCKRILIICLNDLFIRFRVESFLWMHSISN